MLICLERGADLHMAQLMPLPLAVSCFSKTQIGFTFLVPAHPGSPGQRAVKRVRVIVSFLLLWRYVSVDVSLCLCICVSVASRYCVKTAGRIQLVYLTQRLSVSCQHCVVRKLWVSPKNTTSATLCETLDLRKFCYGVSVIMVCCQLCSTKVDACSVNKKLSYRRVTSRCVLSVVILPITTQQCTNYLHDKSWPNRWYEVGSLVGGNVS